MKQKFTGLLVFFIFFHVLSSVAQSTYAMSNYTTNECEGILTDSNNGMLPDTYDNNENYTFKICIPGAQKIVFTFATFCTEEKFDYIRFYDGPDTLSPLIGGPYSGINLPPQITATSGCLTISFISDANLQCIGWIGSWKVIIDEPTPPVMSVIGIVPCESTSLTLKLDQKVSCDSIYPAAFLIYGPQSPNVISAAPVNCVNGKTDEILLNIDPPIKINGNYTVNFTTTFLDVCNKPHLLTAVTSFNVSGCPLYVDLVPQNNRATVCPGECLKLYANITGGDPGSYKIKWSDPKLPADVTVVDVCVPAVSYSVTVTDAVGSVPAIQTFTFQIYPAPQIQWPLANVICQSDPAFVLPAIPTGGTWDANGINDKSKTPAWYEPGRVWQGSDHIVYTDPHGCKDTVDIVVKGIWISNDDASCPGAAPFQVSGWAPVGGVWSGPNITTDGFFDPVASGDYIITYDAPNGCSLSKHIYVGDLVMPPDITICSSHDAFSIQVSPFGGNWDPSPGLYTDWGWFEPWNGKPGLNKLYYSINGCRDSMNLYIVPVDAKWDFNTCTNEQPFILGGTWGPSGGAWSGPGIVDTATGLFNPGLLKDGQNAYLTYTINGCSDTRIAYVRDTKIKKKNALEFCPYDDVIKIDDQNFQPDPCCGNWTGPGTYYVYIKDQDPKNGYYFDPKIAGSGLHPIAYNANGCSDTVYIRVFDLPVFDSISVCSEENPIKLTASLPISVWYGPGIINGFGGIFDPKVAGAGTHDLTFVSTQGCSSSGKISVYNFQKVSIDGLASTYCFKDTSINIVYNPIGGTLLVDGKAQTSFNPVIAGPGIHQISYSYGAGKCADSKTIFVNVGTPITIDLPVVSDSICLGESSKISAFGNGGSSFGNYNYVWDNGIGFGQTQFVFPQVTTSYTVSVSDGCSEIAKASVLIYVQPQFDATTIEGPNVCFGDTTFTTIVGVPTDNYTYKWLTNPEYIGSTYTGSPSNYTVQITNNKTGCQIEKDVVLPGYDLIKANFNISPNEKCISTLDPEIHIIDFSVGATKGTWDFGDGTDSIPYIKGAPTSHTYQDTGTYTIKLYIENEGGCNSFYQATICVEAEHRLFAPNAFSPDDDGVNDKFKFVGLGIKELTWKVFDRWGQQVFTGVSMDDSWDGKVHNKRVPPGIFTYIAKYKVDNSDEEKIMTGVIAVVY